MTQSPNNVDRIESAGDITLLVSRGSSSGGNAQMIEVPISRLDTKKDIKITESAESNIKATGYSIDRISYSGTMMFKGSRKTKTLPDGSVAHLDDLLYDENGAPVPVAISISHDLMQDGTDRTETYNPVLVKSESYQVRSEEQNETAYDWVAMDRKSDQP